MRVPPNNADAEKSVLGCMMQDREALSLAFELLTADDFYQPANREIFDAMHALNTQGMPIDLVTVDDELTRRGTLEGVGGTNYLIELSQCMPSTVNARAYVQIVDEKATLRRMIKATGDIASACYQQTEAVSDILGVAEKSIFDIIMRRHEGSTLTHIADVLPDTYLRIEQLTELKGGIDGVPTGFVDLDNLLTGLHGGELVIVGARPSMGKTSFGMNRRWRARRRRFSRWKCRRISSRCAFCARMRAWTCSPFAMARCATTTGFRCPPRSARWRPPISISMIRPASRRRSSVPAAEG